MKKCSKCGAENRDKNNFCQNCGYKFKDSSFDKSNKNLMERFNNKNMLVKIIILFFIFCIIAFALGCVHYMIFGTHYTEDEPTDQIDLFNEIDLDNDGAISWYEIEVSVNDVPNDKLVKFFEACDKNDNGVLKGGEFDNMVISIHGYFNKLEVLKKMEDKNEEDEQLNSSYSLPTSSSSSGSDYVDGCPECGYDEIVVYDDPDGNTIYQCSVCDYESYDEDDFIIEERFAKSIFPVLKNKLSLIRDFEDIMNGVYVYGK